MDDATGRDAGTIRLEVKPDDFFDEDDPRWRDELWELTQDMEQASVPTNRLAPDGSMKSGFELVPVIIALGTSGAFTAALQAFKAWLGKKPVDRKLKVDYEIGGQKGSINIDATNIESNELTALASEVLASGGSP